MPGCCWQGLPPLGRCTRLASWRVGAGQVAPGSLGRAQGADLVGVGGWAGWGGASGPMWCRLTGLLAGAWPMVGPALMPPTHPPTHALGAETKGIPIEDSAYLGLFARHPVWRRVMGPAAQEVGRQRQKETNKVYLGRGRIEGQD